MIANRHSFVALLLAGSAAVALPAQAQTAPPAQPERDTNGSGQAGEGQEDEAAGSGAEVVVTGQRPPGSVIGDIPPEVSLNPADIRTYGAGSVAELLEALAPQTRSGRGRGGEQPVVLLNGRRISGFAEVRDLPPEAILRVDILPEEVALKYGYRADQRVVNFVLRPRFRSNTAEADVRFPTEGGLFDGELEGGILRIARDRRLSVDLRYRTQTALLESERGIVPAVPSLPFDVVGNITAATPGAEIDPALSAAAGRVVTLAPVPGGSRTLAAYAAGAGVANVTDTTPFRTLRGSSDVFSANATYATSIGSDVSATINGRVEVNEGQSLLGLPSATIQLPAGSGLTPFTAPSTLYRFIDDGNPLQRENRSVNTRAGLALNGSLPASWRWSVNASYDRTETDTSTERGIDGTALQAAVTARQVDPFGPLTGLSRLTDTARSVSSTATVDALANGTLFTLPAGNVTTAIRVSGTTSDFDSRSVRAGITQTGGISRDSVLARANIDLPIASAARDVLAPLGRLSLNFNAEVEQLSDFGTLTTIGYGANWSPVDAVRLIASFTREEGAPSAQQLGDPVVLTPNARVFDFIRGQTVDITRIDGGNPGLSSDTRRAFKLGLTLRPLPRQDLQFRVDFNTSRIDDPIAGFPTATAAIEAAFPDRFQRAADGTLLRIDNRPVNFARSERSEIRYGLDFGTSITTARGRQAQAIIQRFREQREARRAAAEAAGQAVPAEGAAEASQRPPRDGAGPPPGGGFGRGGFGPGSGFGGGRGGFGGPGGFAGGAGGRLQFSVYHLVRLTDTILIRPGLPQLDLLNGDATGSRGGQPRHEIEVNSGLTVDGFGARVEGKWQSATRVDGAVGGTQSLRFGSLTTIGLRLFANLGQRPEIVRRHPFLRGTRVTLAVDNLLNQRIDVTDQSGITPVNYQPGYLDPIGRTLRIGFRKLF